MKRLEKHRKSIDKLDLQILKLLAKRAKVSRSVGKVKKELGLELLQPKRWKIVLESRVKMGKKEKLNSSFIKKLFTLIHKESISIQKNVKAKK